MGQRVLTTLPDGQTITRKYSVAGLLQSETFGDGRTVLYSYDKFGQLTQHINKDGQVTKFVWNEQGELLAKHHNDELIRYSYDSLGRVNATINNAGLWIWSVHSFLSSKINRLLAFKCRQWVRCTERNMYLVTWVYNHLMAYSASYYGFACKFNRA